MKKVLFIKPIPNDYLYNYYKGLQLKMFSYGQLSANSKSNNNKNMNKFIFLLLLETDFLRKGILETILEIIMRC